jgi:hypothetical protein
MDYIAGRLLGTFADCCPSTRLQPEDRVRLYKFTLHIHRQA